MNLKVSLDLDGTVLDFINHYSKYFGTPKTDLDITKKVMGILKEDKEFWMTQPLINIPNFNVHSYCTARVIKKQWIKDQLKVNNLPIAPIYQVYGVSLSKYPQVKRSGADVHIDDSLTVFKSLNARGIPCLLIDSPSNREWGPVGRIYTLDKEEIESAYWLFKDTLFPHFKELL